MDVNKDVPKEIHIEDPNGTTFTQKVSYDRLPPYYVKFLKVGHNCKTNIAKSKPHNKLVQKWVPKAQKPTDEGAVAGAKTTIGDPILLVDDRITGNPSIVVE